MIATSEEMKIPAIGEYFVVGELALDGSIRPVTGIFPITLEARNRGRRFIIVPEQNAAEAAVVSGIITYGVRNLRQVYEFLQDNERLQPATATNFEEVQLE